MINLACFQKVLSLHNSCSVADEAFITGTMRVTAVGCLRLLDCAAVFNFISSLAAPRVAPRTGHFNVAFL
jgi:hypothetical protein